MVKKILQAILENGRIKRTNLCAKTGMNYNRCVKYLAVLRIMKLVEVISDNNCNYVIITDTGKEIIKLLSEF